MVGADASRFACAPVSRAVTQLPTVGAVRIGRDDDAYELVEDRDVIASTWLALPEVERQVLELRFMHDLTQREIGDRIGYSQMHVSRLLRRALTRLETAAAAA